MGLRVAVEGGTHRRVAHHHELVGVAVLEHLGLLEVRVELYLVDGWLDGGDAGQRALVHVRAQLQTRQTRTHAASSQRCPRKRILISGWVTVAVLGESRTCSSCSTVKFETPMALVLPAATMDSMTFQVWRYSMRIDQIGFGEPAHPVPSHALSH